MSNKKILIILGIFFILMFWGLGTHFGQSSKTASKGNVSSDRAGSAVNEASNSAGLGGTPSFGDDPCTRQSKNMPISGKDIKIKSPGEATGMPGKPVANVGKQGQLMEGEEAECKDPSGDGTPACDVKHEGNQVTYENKTKDQKCSFELEDGSRLDLGPESKATITDKSQDKSYLEKAAGKLRSWVAKALAPKSTSENLKTAGGGVRGNCDPYGVTGGCVTEKGSAEVIPNWKDPIGEMEKAEKEGLVRRMIWSKVNPGGEGTGPSTGPKPAKTYPGQVIHMGTQREIEAKTKKGDLVTNPSEESGGSRTGGAGFDFCGNHLLTPEEYTQMKLDPGHVVDPADLTWTGRIEEINNQRILIWEKSITRPDGTSVKLENRHKNGALVSMTYQFYDKTGKKIGYALYDPKLKTVKAERLLY